MAKTPQHGSFCLFHKSSLQRKIPTIHLPGQVMNSSAALCICTVQLKIETSALGCFPPQALHTPACSSTGAKILSEPTTSSGCSDPAQFLGRSQEMQISTTAPHSTQPEPPHSPLQGSPHPVPSATSGLEKPQAQPYRNAPWSPAGHSPFPTAPSSAPGMSAAPAFVQSPLHYMKSQLTFPGLPALPR